MFQGIYTKLYVIQKNSFSNVKIIEKPFQFTFNQLANIIIQDWVRKTKDSCLRILSVPLENKIYAT